MNKVKALYSSLLKKYGKQGWWPVIKDGKIHYHPGDYKIPKNESERFQIVISAVLAQNTSWKNAEKALLSLYDGSALSAIALAKMPETKIARLIRSSGYYNQKTRRIKNLVSAYPSLLKCGDAEEMRKLLLSINGIGPETADSIMLYAFKQPFFVIDAYTRKFCAAHNICSHKNYDEYRVFFEKNLPKDYKIYNEYHALIVEWGKRKKL